MLYIRILNLGKSLGAQQLLGHILRRDADAAAFAEAYARGFQFRLGGNDPRRPDQPGAGGKRQRGQHATARLHNRHPASPLTLVGHAFSSRFSSLKKRQSVLPSMMRLGGILISPASRSRSA